MGIGISVFLLAVGAILTFALDVSTNGFSLHTIGIILMVVGAIGLVASLTIAGSWRRGDVDTHTVVREREVL